MYELTTKRMRLRDGILTRNGRDIPLSRVTDVSFRKGVLDRMLGCGTLLVESAGEHGELNSPLSRTWSGYRRRCSSWSRTSGSVMTCRGPTPAVTGAAGRCATDAESLAVTVLPGMHPFYRGFTIYL